MVIRKAMKNNRRALAKPKFAIEMKQDKRREEGGRRLYSSRSPAPHLPKHIQSSLSHACLTAIECVPMWLARIRGTIIIIIL